MQGSVSGVVRLTRNSSIGTSHDACAQDSRSQRTARRRRSLCARVYGSARLMVPAILVCTAISQAASAAEQPSELDIKHLSLEQLMDIDVYSASRRLELVQGIPAAIFVLTNEDIRRSHATSIPEALRLVPGVDVGRVDANKWAVSIRGFNSREANKLLILIDGRTVYDPLFSGTLWESQDVMLEDVDRIEVIRGPGGTLWGANAVNGVINIITKNARDTAGVLAAATVGTENRYITAARVGWKAGDDVGFRVYAKSAERDTGFLPTVTPRDQSRMQRGGFRWDAKTSAQDEWRVSGDTFAADTGTELRTFQQSVMHRGTNFVASWDRRQSATEGTRAQIYYDSVEYDSTPLGFNHSRDTVDVELQQSVQANPRNLLTWGGDYRRTRDHTATLEFAGFIDVLPARRDDRLSALFLQDSLTLIPESLVLTLGTKYENTDYAAHEWSPNVRLAWTPVPQQLWWLAVSRAARVPSRLEADLTFFNTIRPGDHFDTEHVLAYEVGHRRLISPQLWYDIAAFYNVYTDLRSTGPSGDVRNDMRGITYGAELALRWQPSRQLRVDAAYSYFLMNLDLDRSLTSNPNAPGFTEGLAPRHQISLRGAFDFSARTECDAILRYVDKLRTPPYPPYTALDLGVTWRPHRDWELSLVGQDLLDNHHPEQIFESSNNGIPTEVPQSVYVKVRWQL